MDKTKRLLSRATYKRIKSFDREQLSDYVTKVYVSGYEAGQKAGTPETMMRTVHDVLLSIDGIGPTRAAAIMKKLGDTYALKEKETAPEEGDGTPTETDEEEQADG